MAQNQALDPAEFAALVEELERRHGYFTMDLEFGDLVIVIAQVQLALRHPGNQGHASLRTRGFLEAVIGTLEKSEPRLGQFLRLGFDPGQDV